MKQILIISFLFLLTSSQNFRDCLDYHCQDKLELCRNDKICEEQLSTCYNRCLNTSAQSKCTQVCVQINQDQKMIELSKCGRDNDCQESDTIMALNEVVCSNECSNLVVRAANDCSKQNTQNFASYDCIENELKEMQTNDCINKDCICQHRYIGQIKVIGC